MSEPEHEPGSVIRHALRNPEPAPHTAQVIYRFGGQWAATPMQHPAGEMGSPTFQVGSLRSSLPAIM